MHDKEKSRFHLHFAHALYLFSSHLSFSQTCKNIHINTCMTFCKNWKKISKNIVNKGKSNWNCTIRPMNNTKSAVKFMNSSKNKLNSKIIYNFHPNPNAYLISISILRLRLRLVFHLFFFFFRRALTEFQ